MRSQVRIFTRFASVFILTYAAAGCASYEHCGLAGCPGDSKVTANVQGALQQQPDLGPPDSIRVQTLEQVVYLNGMVATGLQRQEAESVALATPGVKRVENSIFVTH
jgi:osmotically-inducible protein OsmY